MEDASLFRCHDYPFLMARWRRIARAAGLRMRAFARADGLPVYQIHSPGLLNRASVATRSANADADANRASAAALYLSAGIHGDEPAGTEALVRWAAANVPLLRRLPCLIYPCLNPWGLLNNSRLDHSGADLNRTFRHDRVPHIQALKAFIAPLRFRLSLTLHEDYDAPGFYLYELERERPFWGEALVELARALLPIDSRRHVDRRRMTRTGIVRRKIVLARFRDIPEAVYLHARHSQRTFTFETPSECALAARVEAQVRLVDACVRRAFGPQL